MIRGLVVRADACKARESEFDPSYFYPWFDGLEKKLANCRSAHSGIKYN